MPVQLELKDWKLSDNKTGFPCVTTIQESQGEGRGALICYFGREGGRLFGGGHLLERGRLFKEIRYAHYTVLMLCHPQLLRIEETDVNTRLFLSQTREITQVIPIP